jgi:intracellular sulfur oxidation DsrE/DsrF family protein
MSPQAPAQACLLIESRDPFDRPDGGFARQLALQLARRKVQVTLMLVNNGVFAARRGVRGAPLAELAAAGVTMLADEFALRERGIDPRSMSAGVAPSSLEIVIDRLAAGWQVIWH